MMLQYKSNQFWLQNMFSVVDNWTCCQLQGQCYPFLVRSSLILFKVPDRGWRAGSTWGHPATQPSGRAGVGRGCLAKAFRRLQCSRAGTEPCVLPIAWHVVFSLQIQMSHYFYKIHYNASLHFLSGFFPLAASMDTSRHQALCVESAATTSSSS